MPEGVGGRLRGSHFDFAARIVRIHEISDGRSIRHEFVHQLQSLSDRGGTEYRDTCRIATRPVQARHQAASDGVGVSSEHDRNRLGCRRRRLRRRLATSCGDHSHLSACQISRQFRQPIALILCPAEFDSYILVLDVAGLAQPFAECRD